MVPTIFWFIPGAGLLALFVAWYFFIEMKKKHPGDNIMQAIAGFIRQGSMAYLWQQNKVVAIAFFIMSVLLGIAAFVFGIISKIVPFAFITGGFFSALAGYIGMNTSTLASSRVAQAAKTSLNDALQIALRSGAVMSMVVVGLALIDISGWFLVLNHFYTGDSASRLINITTVMLFFGMGASTQALFARVGGGIYTKAADMGADLVGKSEFGLDEDDPRNPAVIADNVGDNVGDVAGMGADLYESYAGATLATTALFASRSHSLPLDLQMKYVLFAMFICAVGVVASVVAIFTIRAKHNADVKKLVGTINRGILLSSVLVAAATFVVALWLGLPDWLELSASVSIGLVVGVVIGFWVNYQTSQGYRPTQRLAEGAKTSSPTVVVGGLALGMKSTSVPVIAVCVGMLGAFHFASIAGVALAAVGMLATLGFVLATDVFGAISDNAGGNAEMAKLPKDVRERTDQLDSVGNTTAAIGKGFAIGSAALTAISLLAAYVEEVKIALLRSTDFILVNGQKLLLSQTNIADLVDYYQVHIMNPKFIVGAFIGAMVVLVFVGLTTEAVGRVAKKMVAEVRRQFSNPRILDGSENPDHKACVRIATLGAQKEMIGPAFLAIASPIITGVLLGVAGVMGLLLSAMTTGFSMAVFLANAGGAWDNAKKYVEEGHFGGKGSDAHKAAIVGDMVGDPCKDTAGPALNVLIKLMSMVAIVTVGITILF
jgi:K(+)-stimulated pyrophosphate-energized sodium pump